MLNVGLKNTEVRIQLGCSESESEDFERSEKSQHRLSLQNVVILSEAKKLGNVECRSQ